MTNEFVIHHHSLIPMVKTKPIPGYLGYFASTDGKIYSAWTAGRYAFIGTRLKAIVPSIGNHGYKAVCLKGKTRLVHRLVLETFIGPCPDGMEACHGPDTNKHNNNLKNLRWGTRGENNIDRMNDSDWHPPIMKGESHPRRKLTDKKVKLIRDLYTQGITPTKLSKQFNVAYPTIKDVLKRRRWKHV